MIGATEGPDVELDLRTLFWRQGSIRGSTMASRAEFDQVYTELAQGHLVPVVDSEWEWEKGVDAFRRLGAPDVFGKVVLRTSVSDVGT